MRISTKSFFKEAKEVPGNSWFDRLHGYVYAKWPYFYIGVGTGEHWLAKRLKPVVDRVGDVILRHGVKEGSREQKKGATFADTYHGKVVPLKAAEQLVSIDKEIRLENLETIIPYQVAKDIMMKHPDHIVALDCPCRVVREDPCLPVDVCLIIGEPFAGFVKEHHPNRSRWITQEEAVKILKEEDERGHVHHAFFKDAMLDRFYAICNCCSCCCGAMQAQRNGVPMLASSGYVALRDSGLCETCGDCIEVCQFNAIVNTNGHIDLKADLCMGCGVCVSRCLKGAVSLKREPNRGEPLEIHRLMEEAVSEIS